MLRINNLTSVVNAVILLNLAIHVKFHIGQLNDNVELRRKNGLEKGAPEIPDSKNWSLIS